MEPDTPRSQTDELRQQLDSIRTQMLALTALFTAAKDATALQSELKGSIIKELSDKYLLVNKIKGVGVVTAILVALVAGVLKAYDITSEKAAAVAAAWIVTAEGTNMVTTAVSRSIKDFELKNAVRLTQVEHGLAQARSAIVNLQQQIAKLQEQLAKERMVVTQVYTNPGKATQNGFLFINDFGERNDPTPRLRCVNENGSDHEFRDNYVSTGGSTMIPVTTGLKWEVIGDQEPKGYSLFFISFQ